MDWKEVSVQREATVSRQAQKLWRKDSTGHLFQLAPFTYQNADGSRGGWEYSVMSALAEKLNFKLDINPPPNGELWGENKNGTFTGLQIHLLRLLPKFCKKD